MRGADASDRGPRFEGQRGVLAGFVMELQKAFVERSFV